MTSPAYTLTPAHFARGRADIDRRLAQLHETHEVALATIAAHEAAVALLDAELVELEAVEQSAPKIAARYPDDSGGGRQAKSRKRKPYADGAPRRANASRPYTAADNARIAAAALGELDALAHDIGRPLEGLERKRQQLLKEIKERDAASPALRISGPPSPTLTGRLVDSGPLDPRVYHHQETYPSGGGGQ